MSDLPFAHGEATANPRACCGKHDGTNDPAYVAAIRRGDAALEQRDAAWAERDRLLGENRELRKALQFYAKRDDALVARVALTTPEART